MHHGLEKINVAEMKMLQWMAETIRSEKIRKEYIK